MVVRPADYQSGRRKFIEERDGESMRPVELRCLHGTFQDPGVWGDLETRLAGDEVHVVAETIEPPAVGGAPAWAEAYCARIARAPRARPPARRVLLGYSLGGRLAMHALAACPREWDAAVLVSAHPGGGSPGERDAVRRRDARWATRCRGEPMADVLRAWDELPVFGGRTNRAPRAADRLDPGRQARMFEAFTRADQADLRPTLAAAALPPTLYVTGADDPRYGALGVELDALLPSLAHVVVPGAGHRVPWERPAEFAARVREFLVSGS